MSTHDTDTQKRATELAAFASILGGLLASGHYTKPEQIEGGSSQLICHDWGKDWTEMTDGKDDYLKSQRFVASAYMDAIDVFREAKRHIELSNAPKEPVQRRKPRETVLHLRPVWLPNLRPLFPSNSKNGK